MDPRISRRRLLQGTVGLTGSLFGPGCLSPANTPTTEPTRTEDNSGTATVDTSTTASAGLKESSLVVNSRTCGNGRNTANISFGDAVVIVGTIAGKDSCQTAELQRAFYDGTQLDVLIETIDSQTAGSVNCTQCLTDIAYQARFVFTGARPRKVTVRHRTQRDTLLVTEYER